METTRIKIHPGRILLEDYLAPRGISVWHLAKDIGVPARRVYEIVQGQRPITADIAHRLAHYFGMSERYWLDLQARYDGKQADQITYGVSKKTIATIRRITSHSPYYVVRLSIDPQRCSNIQLRRQGDPLW